MQALYDTARDRAESTDERTEHMLPEIGKKYDWDCADLGMIRVTVVGHPPASVDPSYFGILAGFCRVQFEGRTAWASNSDLREITE